jgi:hypothetical protein
MLKMMDPEAWVILFLTIGVIVFGGLWWGNKHALELCTAEYNSFTAQTQAAGDIAEKDRSTKETALANAAVNIQRSLTDEMAKTAALTADVNRLRANAKASARSSQASDLAAAAPLFECSAADTRLESALDELEAGIIQELVQPRDEAITMLNGCKAYLDQIEHILGVQNVQSER